MPSAIHVPRVNNNDDEVKLTGLQAAVGERVTKGQALAQVETDKAVVDVEADRDGYVLAVNGQVDEVLRVGSVLAWIGETADELVPVAAAAPAAAANTTRSTPTAKASALLAQHGIDAALVPAEGERLTVADVERYLLSLGTGASAATAPAAPAARAESRPEVAGELRTLKSEERGMLATVSWHRDHAVPGYVEVGYDPAGWESYAKAFGTRHGLLLNPLLPLMCWRLVELARENPRLNATIVDHARYEYSEVNLGFTVQAGDVLYLAVVRDAASLGELGFVNALIELQRRAAGHKLGPREISGTTIGFSSMARWKVSRHMPVLPPHTTLMVAHAESHEGAQVLGATYDHRVLNGAEAAGVLRKLARAPKAE